MDFRKNKNYYEFETENKKVYKYDINTNTYYGLRGKPVQNIPSAVKQTIRQNCRENNVFGYLTYIFNYTYETPSRQLCSICDRLDSMGITLNTSYMYAMSNLTNDEWEIIIKYISKHLGFYQGRQIDFEKLQKVIFIATFSHSDFEIDDTVYHILKGIRTEYYTNKDKIKWIMSYIRECNALVDTDILYSSSVSEMINNYFFYCDTMNIAYQKKILIQYPIVKRMYDMEKEKFDNQRLSQNQLRLKDKILFENENYQVVIPTTTTDFKNEADYQRNCVYSMYLKRCIEGISLVVFIRDKNDLDKSLITCEVNKNNGQIMQYLERFNHRPTDDKLVEFKRLYQDFLNSQF